MSQGTNGGKKAEQYYRVDITRYPPLSVDDEIALFADYQKKKTKEKLEQIVRQYLYWAAELACRYCGPRMSRAEATSAANYGLMLAIDRFDPKLGKRFVTYSYFAIRREVLYALRDSYVVNPESGLWASRHTYNTSEKNVEDAARRTREWREIFANAGHPTSIGPQADGGGPEETVGSAFCEEDCRQEVEQASLLDELQRILPSLSKECGEVIQLRYFNNGKAATYPVIAEKLGCSVDHARWAHDQAIQLLQKKLRNLKKEL